MPFLASGLAVRPRWRQALNFDAVRPTKLVVGQVSLPMRIALVATLAFSAIWFVALRPKPPAADPSPPAPAAAAPQSAPGKAAAQAQQAVGASNESAAKHEAAAGSVGEQEAATGSAPARSTAEQGAQSGARIDVKKAAGAKASKAALSVLEDVVKGKVAVLLFWDRRLTDDQAVHRAVVGLDRRGGKVAVHKAPIARLAEFEAITSGVPVVTSPTVLVIDRAGRARSVGGLTVPGELEELVGRALRVKP